MRAGLKVGVGTAGDRHNIAFVFSHLQDGRAPTPWWVATKACPASPSPPSFWKRRGAWAPPARCIVFEDAPLALKPHAAPACGPWRSAPPHADELAGPHVMASVRDYNELI
jgi:beta-phosphoglucomutase-like phosphatase (HAD superfamily)